MKKWYYKYLSILHDFFIDKMCSSESSDSRQLYLKVGLIFLVLLCTWLENLKVSKLYFAWTDPVSRLGGFLHLSFK